MPSGAQQVPCKCHPSHCPDHISTASCFCKSTPSGQHRLHPGCCFPSTPHLWVLFLPVHHQDSGGGVSQGKTSPVREPVPKPVPAGAGGDAEAGAEGDGAAAAEFPKDGGSAPSSGLSATGVNQKSPHPAPRQFLSAWCSPGDVAWQQVVTSLVIPPLAPLPDHDVRG